LRSTEASRAPAPARFSTSTSMSPPNASISSTACSPWLSQPIRASISSTSRGGALTGPFQRQIPSTRCSALLSSPPSTSSRRNSGWPTVSSQSWCTADPSTCPPSAAASSSAVSSLVSRGTSRRPINRSFHSEKIGSGTIVPAQALTTTNAARVAASWWISVAEVWSRRCASSTARTIRRLPALLTRWRTVSWSSRAGSGAEVCAGGSRWATAPNGRVAAALVACIQWMAAPVSSARATASWTRRVRPEPIGPTSIVPWLVGEFSASSTSFSSRRRPTSGHSLVKPSPPAIATVDVRPHMRLIVSHLIGEQV
jgi:hypothetical protein